MNKNLSNPAIEAINTLALALTEHSHQWTKKERSLYKKAMKFLTSSCGAG